LTLWRRFYGGVPAVTAQLKAGLQRNIADLSSARFTEF
jgi:hypothetical protein